MFNFSTALLLLSFAITIVFFAYGFNIYYMLKLSRRYKAPLYKSLRKQKPTVAIHLPIYNEQYVIPRLLASCTATARQYGKDLVRILILDDSDDETTSILEVKASEYRVQGFNIEVKHRSDRSGFKAGALNTALAETMEEFVVVFDSDFVPKSDFLDRATTYITADWKIGVVQFRWSYTNRNYNWITKSVSIGMDAHFLIEQPARYSGGLFLNFNGSGGIIRVSALRESGGWQSDTLAEDLDASYRMQLKHYRIQYVQDSVPCEVTPTVASFKRQQARWARGSLQVAKKSLMRLLSAKDVNTKQKFAGSIHLTYYLVHPLMYFSFILAAVAAVYNINSISITLPSIRNLTSIGTSNTHFSLIEPLWVIFGTSIVLCTVAAWVYYIVAMRRQGMKILKNVPSLTTLGFLGYGISISNTLEALEVFLLKDTGTFKRTPKYAMMESRGSWRDKKYQVPLDLTSVIEAVSIAFAVFAISRAVHFVNYGLVFILGVYCTAFLFVFFTTILQSGKEKAVVRAFQAKSESQEEQNIVPPITANLHKTRNMKQNELVE